jgi:hypothetical protein
MCGKQSDLIYSFCQVTSYLSQDFLHYNIYLISYLTLVGSFENSRLLSKEQELDDHHDENGDDAIFHPTLSY